MNSLLKSDFTDFALCPGARLHTLSTDKFKMLLIRLVLSINLDERVSALALLASALGLGTEKYPSLRRINRELEEMFGASFDIDVIKSCERLSLQLCLDCPAEKYLQEKYPLTEKALAFLFEILCRPALENGAVKAEHFELAKLNLRNDILGIINDKREYTMVRAISEMCKGEPFALDRYGTLEGLDALTPRTLTDFHKKLLATAQLDLYVAGNLPGTKAASLVKKLFPIKRGTPEIIRPPVIKKKMGRPRTLVEKQKISQGNLVMGFRFLPPLRPEERFAAIFADSLLGRFPHSRLFQVVREKEGLVYSIHSNAEVNKSLFVVVAGIAEKNFEKTKKLVLAQIKDIAAGHISREEFENTRVSHLNSLQGVRDNLFRMTSLDLDGRWSHLATRPEDMMRGLADVTVQDVAGVVARLQPDLTYFLKS